MPRKDVLSFVNQGKNKNHRSKIGTLGKKHPDCLNKSKKYANCRPLLITKNLTFGGEFCLLGRR